MTPCNLTPLGLLLVVATTAAAAPLDELPNVVVIFTDDQGWGDVGCFGAEGFVTPNLDRMAAEGTRFTNFYVSAAVCSASRSSLLTGCYNQRLGITGAFGPDSRKGLHTDEVTFAELAKSRGYATAMFGKWHLGDEPELLPTNQGFDEYYGLPYSHDMWPLHPNQRTTPTGSGANYPPLPSIEQDAVADAEIDEAEAANLTTAYTERAVDFVDRHADSPFLLYLAHSMPHVPLYVSEKFASSQPGGLYGDVIREIDWSVGQVLDAIDRNGLAESTLVLFCSDNGPWLAYGDHAGSAGPFREGKGTTFEGGVRTPMIARMPGQVPAGRVCETPAMTIDVFPTIARLLGAEMPAHPIDGTDLWPLLTGHPQAGATHEAFYFFWHGRLEAVRVDNWKLHYPHRYRSLTVAGENGQPGKYEQLTIEKSLFDLSSDEAETTNVLDDHPDVVARIDRLAAVMRQRLGDGRTGETGSEVRPLGMAATDTVAGQAAPRGTKKGDN